MRLVASIRLLATEATSADDSGSGASKLRRLKQKENHVY